MKLDYRCNILSTFIITVSLTVLLCNTNTIYTSELLGAYSVSQRGCHCMFVRNTMKYWLTFKNL